jgi:hypothetical protein
MVVGLHVAVGLEVQHKEVQHKVVANPVNESIEGKPMER